MCFCLAPQVKTMRLLCLSQLIVSSASRVEEGGGVPVGEEALTASEK